MIAKIRSARMKSIVKTKKFNILASTLIYLFRTSSLNAFIAIWTVNMKKEGAKKASEFISVK